jgi:flagellar hook assembly protein FlgD
MAVPGYTRLKVYDAAGHLVVTLVDEYREAGGHQVIWDGRDHAGRMSSAGVYLYRLEAGSFSETKRMVLIK